MNWKDNFIEGKEIVLATASRKGIPNANLVVSLGLVDGKLLVADCLMDTTFKNLDSNGSICVIGGQYRAGYYRLKGTVEIFTSGKYFDYCVEKSKGYTVKHAILITIQEVFDLDKVKLVGSQTL